MPCRPDRPQTFRDPPASFSQVLELKVCVTTHSPLQEYLKTSFHMGNENNQLKSHAMDWEKILNTIDLIRAKIQSI